MSCRQAALGALLLSVFASTRADAATHSLIKEKTRDNDPTIPCNLGAYAIIHSLGYASFGGPLTVRICVAPGSKALITGREEVLV